MNVLSKEESTSMYHISKTRPGVEDSSVIHEVTPATVTSNLTTNQAENQVHNEQVFVSRFKGNNSAGIDMIDAKPKRKFS